MLLGFDEVQTDVLLVLWEAGGELPLWGDGTVTDLCHELDLTSSTIKQSIKPLEVARIVRVTSRDRALWIRAISPRELGDRISESFQQTGDFISEFFHRKSIEFNKSRPNRSPRLQQVLVNKTLLEELRKLSDEKKVIYGLLGGRWSDQQQETTIFYRVGCRSGPKIHLMPNWEEFHRTKRSMVSAGDAPLIEFHTHPGERATPAPADIAKMKMLRLGYWAIGGTDGVRFYQFYHERTPKLKLAVDELTVIER